MEAPYNQSEAPELSAYEKEIVLGILTSQARPADKDLFFALYTKVVSAKAEEAYPFQRLWATYLVKGGKQSYKEIANLEEYKNAKTTWNLESTLNFFAK